MGHSHQEIEGAKGPEKKYIKNEQKIEGKRKEMSIYKNIAMCVEKLRRIWKNMDDVGLWSVFRATSSAKREKFDDGPTCQMRGDSGYRLEEIMV